MASNERNITLDLIRLIAAFGVISLHVPFNTAAAGSFNTFFWPLSVPFFYIASLTYFVAGLKKGMVIWAVLKRMWWRLILPYLAWTAVYVIAIVLKSKLVGLQHNQHTELVWWRMVFYGESAVQMYYLPQLIVMQAVALSVYAIAFCNNRQKFIGVVILGLAAFFYVWGNLNNAFGLMSLSGLAVFLIIAVVFSWLPRTSGVNYQYIICGIILTLFTIAGACFLPNNAIVSEILQLPLGGAGLFLLALGFPKTSAAKWLLTLYSTSYGVYLCHIIFLESFDIVGKKLNHGEVYYDFKTKLFFVIAIFLCSVGFTIGLRAFALTKRVFLGEGSIR